MSERKGCSVGCIFMISILVVVYLLYVYYLRIDVLALYYLLIKPKDIEVALVKEEFFFDKEGYERIYTIKPKYRGDYNIFIQFENFDINREKLLNVCKGEIEICYISNGKVIRKEILDKYIGYQFSRNYDRWYQSIYLDQFIYYNDIFRKDVDSIKIKVNKPIQCFPKGKDKKTYLVIEYTYNL